MAFGLYKYKGNNVNIATLNRRLCKNLTVKQGISGHSRSAREGEEKR